MSKRKTRELVAGANTMQNVSSDTMANSFSFQYKSSGRRKNIEKKNCRTESDAIAGNIVENIEAERINEKQRFEHQQLGDRQAWAERELSKMGGISEVCCHHRTIKISLCWSLILNFFEFVKMAQTGITSTVHWPEGLEQEVSEYVSFLSSLPQRQKRSCESIKIWFRHDFYVLTWMYGDSIPRPYKNDLGSNESN